MRRIRICGLQRAVLGVSAPIAHAADLTVEGEALARSGKFLINAGKAQVRPMSS